MIESTPPDNGAPKTGLDIHDILKILPHRYPFLLIDRVLELKRKESIVAMSLFSMATSRACRSCREC